MNRLGAALILVGVGLWGSLFWQAFSGRVSTRPEFQDEDFADPAKLAKLSGLKEALKTGNSRDMVRELDKFLPDPTAEKEWPLLLRQLADEDASKREKAFTTLVEAGPVILGFARRARSMETDLTARASLAELEEALPLKSTVSALTQAIRQADITKDQASVRTLFWRLVTHAPDPSVEEILYRELEADLAVPGGLDVTKANLENSDPARRELAVRLLASREEPPDWGNALDRLKADPDPAVALRTMFYLADTGKPVLARSLADRLRDGPPALCRVAEARLLALAPDSARVPPWAADASQRQAAADGWREWLADPGREKLALQPAHRWDRMVTAQANFRPYQRESLLLELEKGGKVRERVLTGNLVLSCGYDPSGTAWCLRSQGTKGEIVRPFDKEGQEKSPPLQVKGRLVAACPKGGGEFVIIGRDSVSVVGAEGQKELVPIGKRIVSGGAMGRDGSIALWLDDGTIAWYASDGTPGPRLRFAPPQVVGAGIQALPGQRLLLPVIGENRVVEIDREGRELRSLPVESPLAVFRLPDGDTLVATPEGILKFDLTDRQVSRQRVDFLPVSLSVRLLPLP